MSRRKVNNQGVFDFQGASLQVTKEYFEKYENISGILRACPELLDCIHRDIGKHLDQVNGERSDSYRYRYTTDHVLRCYIVMLVEGLSLRDTVVRIDDSNFLRWFTKIHDASMMDFTTLNRLVNAISAKTWKKVNDALAEFTVKEQWISGDSIRLDTTAVETNIHYPTDASLLFDSYRVLGGLIEKVRELDPDLVGSGRVRTTTIKKYLTRIARNARKNADSLEALKPQYKLLIRAVEGLCDWAQSIAQSLTQRPTSVGRTLIASYLVELRDSLLHYLPLARHVAWQARERVLRGHPVPNDQKLFSIFEEHTELLIRGKAGKNVEFGHMIGLQQVREKFITDYRVFEKKPVEHQLVEPALESHQKLFGCMPGAVAADKGYWENREALERLEKKVKLVAIGKKGRRTEEEDERELSEPFRNAQRFRAGIEGTISFLKRVLGLVRCVRKGFEHYAAAIGATVFAHNLLVLTRL